MILLIALVALYGKYLAGAWRWIYVVTAVAALWFIVLVLIVQSFQKVPQLQPLAPTQSEPPFLIAQAVLFVVLGFLAVLRFHPLHKYRPDMKKRKPPLSAAFSDQPTCGSMWGWRACSRYL